MSRTLLQAANRRRIDHHAPIETILTDLGDRSFAWAMLFFAILNLVPAPPGSTLVMAIPLLLITGQMALGFHHVRLPAFITRRTVPRDGFRAVVIRLRPLIRPIERVIRPRQAWLFSPANERIVGAFLFAVAVALYIPLPGSGAIPAFALFVSALGLLERDGVVLGIGVTIGAAAIAITAAIVTALMAGFDKLF